MLISCIDAYAKGTSANYYPKDHAFVIIMQTVHLEAKIQDCVYVISDDHQQTVFKVIAEDTWINNDLLRGQKQPVNREISNQGN